MITQFAPAIEACLAAQERFEKLRAEVTLRHGKNLCDLGYANPYDGAPPQVIEAMHNALDSGRSLDLQYTPYGGATVTRRLIAEDMSRRVGARFHYRNIVMTPGAMAGLNLLFRTTIDQGPGEVVVIVPCWLDYPLYLANLGLTMRAVAIDPDSFHLDLQAIERALGKSTRAVVLSQPANPTGIVYNREELTALSELIKRKAPDALLISDECHRDICFGATEFVSPAEIHDNTAVVYSFGKSLFIQGQRTAYVAVSPRMEGNLAYSEMLERLCRVMGFCTPTALMQLAVRSLLGVQPDLSRVEARRTRMIEGLQAAGYTLVPSDGTFFLYPKTPVADDFAFVERLGKRGLLALPAVTFHHQGHLRLSFTASDAMIDRALGVLAELARS